MKLHLYEFHQSTPAPVDGATEWVLSTLPAELVRKNYHIWDSGDVPFEIFSKTFEKGEVREIHSPADLDPSKLPSWFRAGDVFYETVLDILPYTTDEQVYCEELGGDFLTIDISVRFFFNGFYGREFPDAGDTGIVR